MGYNFRPKKGKMTMEQNPVEIVQEELSEPTPKTKKVRNKKAYTPPALTVYGNLSELTGGGTKSKGEGTPGSLPSSKP
jgi:hypothetical protein